MAISNGYATLAEAKARLDITGTAFDTVLENVIEAASRWIDGYCARRFYAATQTRYFVAEFSDLLLIDDLLTLTTLKTDDDGDRTYETTWASTDYDLEPNNATLESPAQPYTRLRTTPNGNYSFPVGVRKGVEIAGSWGYVATAPDAVNDACLLLVARLFRRKDAPFGVIGGPEIGQTAVVARVDPDVAMLLAPYQQLEVAAV